MNVHHDINSTYVRDSISSLPIGRPEVIRSPWPPMDDAASVEIKINSFFLLAQTAGGGIVLLYQAQEYHSNEDSTEMPY